MKLKTKVEVMGGSEATVAEMKLEGFCVGDKHTFTGEAKKHPKDQPDRITGRYYAMARMFQQAAEEYQEMADQRVRNSGERFFTWDKESMLGNIYWPNVPVSGGDL